MKEKLHWPETLKKAMAEARENNVTLAAAIGVSHVAIGNFLDGQFPKSEHLFKIAEHYNLPMDWFFGRSRFLEALEKSGVQFERHGPHLEITLREKAEVSVGKLIMEIGRLIDSGINPAELLRRLRADPGVSYSKKVAKSDAVKLTLDVGDTAHKKPPA